MYAGTYKSENEVHDEKRKYGDNTYELASLNDRFIALMIDFAIVAVISASFAALTGRRDAGEAIFFIVQIAYQWYFLVQSKGQTPGKTMKHLRIVKTDGTPITGTDVVLRVAGYVLNNILMLGWICAANDANRQGWHDKMAKTIVVQE